MWTPRRILLLALGAVLAFAGYTAYASCLGGIDGLPPLPEADWPNPNPDNHVTILSSHVLKLDEKLVLAFGPECPQLKCSLKLEMNQKSMVVTARVFTIEDDGRLKLDDLSLALFVKPKEGDTRDAEINTVRAKTARLTFDKPLGKSEKDLGGNRHIVAAELNDDIEIVNNHHTRRRDDDLHLIIDKGPLYYDEAKHLIWTADNVHVEDDAVKPKPNDVRGQGMEVHLASEAPKAPEKAGGRGKPKSEAFTGVERIVLLANVDMNLYVGGGFLNTASGNTQTTKAAVGAAAAAAPTRGASATVAFPLAHEAKPAAPAESSHLSIYTAGPFQYTFRKDGDLAVFDVPPTAAAGPVNGDEYVTVVRDSKAPDGKGLYNDQLNCQHLELRLSHKDGGAAGAHDGREADNGMEVQSAHAVGEKEIVLVSDAEGLTAGGYDLNYDAANQLTILKGDPAKPDSGMWADSKGSLIHAREMRIEDIKGPGGKTWRQATAKGPGRLDMEDGDKKDGDKKDGDKKDGDKKDGDKRPIHATWQDKLISTKEGDQDLMILTGAACFADEEHDQTLGADTLKVWLPPPGEGRANATAASAPNPRRPNRVQATGNVTAQSRDMVIPHAAHLVVWFHDVHDEETLPTAAPLAKAVGPTAVRESAKLAPPAVQDLATPPPPPPGATPAAVPNVAKAPEAPPRPIDLTARFIYAWVARGKEKNTLERLQAEGDVHVIQAPANADEKGVDIKGAALDMTYHPEGNFLVVEGGKEGGKEGGGNDLAQLLMDKIYIVGPEVNIDQAANKSWVIGPGAMQMESRSNFQGETLAKPVPMSVYWNQEMFFTGASAEFTGGVQAEQENAHIACQAMQVVFDHPISLKEGNRNGPPPRAKSLTCSHAVRVEDRTLEGERLVRSSRLQAPDLAMNAIPPDDPDPKGQEGSRGNEVRAPGPGDLRIWQRAGAGDDPLAAPRPPGAKPEPAKPGAAKAATGAEPMKLTYICYGAAARGSMYANTMTNTAVFLDNVRVLDMPCEDPNVEIDLDAVPDHLPEGAMYLRGDRLDVFNHGDKTRSQKEMIAKGHVRVQTREFTANSNLMTYNEAKDQVIFEGGEGGMATLFKVKQRGGQPQKIEGKKIIYIRSTGRFQIDDGDWISGEN